MNSIGIVNTRLVEAVRNAKAELGIPDPDAVTGAVSHTFTYIDDEDGSLIDATITIGAFTRNGDTGRFEVPVLLDDGGFTTSGTAELWFEDGKEVRVEFDLFDLDRRDGEANGEQGGPRHNGRHCPPTSGGGTACESVCSGVDDSTPRLRLTASDGSFDALVKDGEFIDLKTGRSFAAACFAGLLMYGLLLVALWVYSEVVEIIIGLNAPLPDRREGAWSREVCHA